MTDSETGSAPTPTPTPTPAPTPAPSPAPRSGEESYDRAAVEARIAAIRTTLSTDPQAAYDQARELQTELDQVGQLDQLDDVREVVAQLRKDTVAGIWDAEALSLAHLAERRTTPRNRSHQTPE